jgi:hypothetical protein
MDEMWVVLAVEVRLNAGRLPKATFAPGSFIPIPISSSSSTMKSFMVICQTL